MLAIRRSADRGHGRHGWLDSRHTFSFAGYHDPAFVGFGDLLVINEDRVAPGAGFPTHSHQHMEILSYVLEGALAHADSLGNGSVIRPGQLQRMSAGTGISHSEFNASENEKLHFLQIWIEPSGAPIGPQYEERSIPPDAPPLALIGSPEGEDGSIVIHQDVRLYRATPQAGTTVDLNLRAGRRAWIQVARGSAAVNGHSVMAGDGAALTDERAIEIAGVTDVAELLVFDLR